MSQKKTDNSDRVHLEKSWKEKLIGEFEKPYMLKLKDFLMDELKKKKIIYPKGEEYFAALNLTPLENVKVVILGQDPYHGPGQAHGLSFSVRPGVRFPPSLQNIFKELKSDLGIATPSSGSLIHWAEEGVLLLNSVLTVEDGKPASHQGRGWEVFTDKIISILNEDRENIVFILWGAYAQKKASFLDKRKHCVLMGPHPSPLSSHRGFFGSKPFSKANAYLESKGLKPIDWRLPV